jgi:hypothetical protein
MLIAGYMHLLTFPLPPRLLSAPKNGDGPGVGLDFIILALSLPQTQKKVTIPLFK